MGNKTKLWATSRAVKQAVMMELPKKPSGDLKGFSCVSCRQRKVRCDRRAPCMNCTKAERQCNFVAPIRGKRKRTKPPRETLHARLRRYEEMLKAYGAKIEPNDGDDGSDSEAESQSLNTPASSDGAMSTVKTDREDPMPAKFIMKEGASRYYDRYGWRLVCKLHEAILTLLVLCGPTCQKM